MIQINNCKVHMNLPPPIHTAERKGKQGVHVPANTAHVLKMYVPSFQRGIAQALPASGRVPCKSHVNQMINDIPVN